MASPLHLAAAISLGAAMIPAGLAELRIAVRPVPPKPPGTFRHASVMPGSEEGGRGTQLGGGYGHVVAMQQNDEGTRSELTEVALGELPRHLATLHGGAAMPSVGTDARGRVTVIVSGCAVSLHDEPEPPKPCNLTAVDLATGK